MPHLREEWIILREPHLLFMIITRFAHHQDRLDIGIEQPYQGRQQEIITFKGTLLLELITVRVDLKFTTVVRALEGDEMGKGAYCTTFVFPTHTC